MNDLFNTCLAFTVAQEGWFVNDPRDPGGATYKGITLASLREYLRAPNTPVSVLRGLDQISIAKFYRSQFWDICQCGVVPAGIDLMLFDHGVNAGAQHPVPMLQDLIEVEADGAIGPLTLAAIATWRQSDLIGALGDAQEEYYRGLKNFTIYGNGWLNRLSRRYTASIRLAALHPVGA